MRDPEAWGKRNPHQDGRRRRPIIPRTHLSNLLHTTNKSPQAPPPTKPRRGDVFIAPPRGNVQIARRARFARCRGVGKMKRTPNRASKTSFNSPRQPSLIFYITPIYPKNSLVFWPKSKTLWLYGLKTPLSILCTFPSILKNKKSLALWSKNSPTTRHYRTISPVNVTYLCR